MGRRGKRLGGKRPGRERLGIRERGVFGSVVAIFGTGHLNVFCLCVWGWGWGGGGGGGVRGGGGSLSKSNFFLSLSKFSIVCGVL